MSEAEGGYVGYDTTAGWIFFGLVKKLADSAIFATAPDPRIIRAMLKTLT